MTKENIFDFKFRERFQKVIVHINQNQSNICPTSYLLKFENKLGILPVSEILAILRVN